MPTKQIKTLRRQIPVNKMRRVSRKSESAGSASKCDDCKNNARLGFVGVLPLCIITGMKEDGQVVSCPNHEATD